MLCFCNTAEAQQTGSIRGVVYDADFDAPLALAEVTLAETGEKVTATEQGNYVFNQVTPGNYTLIFWKSGYARQVRGNVIVNGGQLTEVDARLAGDFTEMEEFVVQELQIGGGTEAGLLQLRFEAPALLDSISSELMSRAGASDAASALRLVAGASVQDGKFAVIRGLPDRYVNTQMNGVRLPTADENKRAVQLDQFPSAVIESIQVSKTFTPDQQGDASGGAVNVVLKGIPDQFTFQAKVQYSINDQVSGRTDFLTYDGGGVSRWGRRNSSPPLDLLGQNWPGAVGTSRGDAPNDYKYSLAGGGMHKFDNDVVVGAFLSYFYERDSSFYDNGIDDEYWVTTPGAGLVPRTTQGTPDDGDFKTHLYDVTQGTESVQWGFLGTAGVRIPNHEVNFTYLYTRIAEDTATLAEDTRGKEYFFPGYSPNDPLTPGNSAGNRTAAPYLRTQTLQYTERISKTAQLRGKHTLAFIDDFGKDDFLMFHAPVIDWTLAKSSAELLQPDKRQFGSLWLGPAFNPGFPPFIPPFTVPSSYQQYKPDANFLLGNLQHIYKEISEDSDQYFANLKIPFTQWTGTEGYLKFGFFNDDVHRKYDQETFSNFNDASTPPTGIPFTQFWSDTFPDELHPITDGPPFTDVDYRGDQNIKAWYAMADVPLNNWFSIIGGARFESTEISIVNIPEENATWFPEGSLGPAALLPGDSDVSFEQDDVLPSIGFVFKPIEQITLRGSYSETVARQTFKELTPILQQEYLGGEIFIGNPDLRMSSLENYDLRLEWTPVEGSLVSVSYFYKDVVDPIEYVQRVVSFTYTTPVNYPEGTLEGWEFEVRQDLGTFAEGLDGLSVGANATFINSEVMLTAEESAQFEAPNVLVPMRSRDMTNAPEHLYNLYLTYDLDLTGTQFSIFYTVTGDTLVAGAGVSNGNFVPNVYEREYDTLNLSVTQKLGQYIKLTFQVKNLTNPRVEQVYRSSAIGSDVVKTSYTKGVEYSIGLSAEFNF